MSHLLDFYRLQSPDSERRMLSDYWQWDDEQFELCHDFIQWQFPLDEPSMVNADAPLVTSQDQKAFREELQLQVAYRRSIAKFLEFLGLQIGEDGSVSKGPHFDRRLVVWQYTNHNWLRITRLLKSIRLLGFEKEAAALWACLRSLHKDDGFVSERAFEYWEEAASGLQ